MEEWIQKSNEHCILLIYARPNAGKDRMDSFYGDPPRIKIKLKAQPLDGKANEALLKFLAKFFKISKSRIHLLRGETSKTKDVLIELPCVIARDLILAELEK